MAQINVPKLNMYARLGSEGTAVVSKLNMYARLVPGDGGADGLSYQSSVYAQKLAR